MEEPIALQLFLIGFHHKTGWKKDTEFPKKTSIPEEDLEHLPSLCIADQSHNFVRDSTYFVLPRKKELERGGNGEVFGVSCFRQIPIEQVNRSENDEFSRSSVQKSVCCLSRLPLFGYIEVKLNIIVDKIFENGSFDCEKLLEESYYELNRCLSHRISGCLDDSSFISFNDDFINDFYIGTFLRELLIQWRHKVLVLFKLFLLEKRVLFFGSPVLPLCSTILSVLSLHPQMLNQGMCSYFKRPSLLIAEQQDNEETDQLKNSCSSELKTPDNDSIRSEDIDSLKQITILPTIPPSEYLAPMRIFRNGALCLPFISLQYIDTITDSALSGDKSFIVGASNILFMHKKNLFDVVIDVTSQTIDVINQDLKKCLSLSTEDLRFVEFLIRGLENPRSDGYGTDCWIREQFESYFTSMLRTLYDTQLESNRDLEAFNEHYMEVWRKTNNYQDWLAQKITLTHTSNDITAFDTFPRGHPFVKKSGQAINVGDFRNKIVQRIGDTQSARKINQAVNSTFLNAKSSFSSLFSNLSNNFSSPKDEIAQDVVLGLDEQVIKSSESSTDVANE